MTKTFYLKIKMQERWIPHFFAMLNYMEYLGAVGKSRKVTFYSDGDGDFRPKFRTFWGKKLKTQVTYKVDKNGDRTYDAG